MFKVGDWVRTEKGIFQIESIDEHDFIEGVVHDIQIYFTDKTERWDWRDNCILWQPKEGEWCWYDEKYFVNIHKISKDQFYFHSLDGMYIDEWDYLKRFEPFIGELPSCFRKEK